MFKIHKKYLIASIILFLVEVLIAIYVHDKIIRPYIGDVLVVVLMYCFINSIVSFNKIKVGVFVLLFSFLVELLQLLNLVKWLGLEKNKLACVIIGNSFSWIDILCYIVGILLVFILEQKLLKNIKTF